MTSFSSNNEVVHEYYGREYQGRGELITPNIIAKRYEISSIGNSRLGNQSVILFKDYSNSDVKEFFKQFAPDLIDQMCSPIHGVNIPTSAQEDEPNLDVEYIMSVGKFIETKTYNLAYMTVPLYPQVGITIVEGMLDYTYIVGNQVIILS